MTLSLFLVPLLCLFIAQGCFCQLKQCYNPSGTAFPDFPCDPTANVSACCGQNYTCTTNFYCTSPTDHGVVGSCTDQTWQNPACPLSLSPPILMLAVLIGSQTLTTVQILGTTSSTIPLIQPLAPMGLSVPGLIIRHAVLTTKDMASQAIIMMPLCRQLPRA